MRAKTIAEFAFKFSTICTKLLFPEIYLAFLSRKSTRLLISSELLFENFNMTSYHEKDTMTRSSPSEVFLGKGILKICSKFIGEHPYRSAFSIKLPCNLLCFATLLKSHFGMGVLLYIC